MNKSQKNEEKLLLFKTILELKTVEDCQDFFDDLCTIKELEAMGQRVYAAKQLLDKKTYEQIISLTDISSATLSRVSRCVQYGKGYSKFIK